MSVTPTTEQPSYSSSLLLLSAEVTPVCLQLGTFYRILLQKTISSLKGQGSYLDVAVHHSCIGPYARGSTFNSAQMILFSLYSEISALLEQENKTNLIDVRIVFVYYPSETGVVDFSLSVPIFSNYEWPFGPIISLSTLIKPGRNWERVTVAGTESSVQLFQEKLSSLDIPHFLYHMEIYSKLDFEVVPKETDTNILSHSIAAVGGTFDSLHAGHKLLLTMAAYILQPSHHPPIPRLIIGLTGTQLLKKKEYADLLSSWETRAAETFDFLKKILIFDEENSRIDITNSPSSASTPQSPVTPAAQTITFTWSRPQIASCSLVIEIVEINDPFGPTITNQDITVLLVSKETESGGQLINQMREEKGWRPLEIKVVGLIIDRKGSQKLSSTEIRRRKTTDATR